MNDIEKRARELLIQSFRNHGMDDAAGSLNYVLGKFESGTLRACVDAIIAALTLPEGYVLIKADTLQDLATDAEEYVRSTEFRKDHIESKLESVREAQSLLTPEAP